MPHVPAVTPARLTLEAAAKRAGVSVNYLASLLRHGGVPYVLAVRLAPIIGISEDALLRGGITLPRDVHAHQPNKTRKEGKRRL